MSYLLTDAYVVTVDKERRVIENGAVLIEKDRIAAVGETDQLLARFPDAERLSFSHKMIVPGLIDVHAHAGHSLFTMFGSATDSNWMNILTEIYHHQTTERFWLIEGRKAAMERLMNGVTCGLSVLTNCQRSDTPAIGVNQAQGYAEVGIRGIIAVGPSNPPFPRHYTIIEEDGSRRKVVRTFDQQMEVTEDTIAKVNGSHNGLISGFVAPFVQLSSLISSGPTPVDLAVRPDEQDQYLANAVRQVAKNQKTRIHTESFGGMIRLSAMLKNPLLGSDVHLQHCIGISLEEAKIISETGTHVSSTPYASAFWRRCPVPELMVMGANVVTATDGTAPSSTFDLIKTSQNMQLVHQGFLRDGNYLPAGKLLEMITLDAAKAIGRAEDLGSIEVGKKADLIAVDLNRPHLVPRLMSLRKWLLTGSGADVNDVFVDGQWVLKDREPVRVSSAKVLADGHAEAVATIKRAKMDEHLLPTDRFWGAVHATLETPRS